MSNATTLNDQRLRDKPARSRHSCAPVPGRRMPPFGTAVLLIYLLGLVHWLCFFFLQSPPTGDRAFVTHPPSIRQWFRAAETFTAHDWYKELAYHDALRHALRQGVLPYHVPEVDELMGPLHGRFLGLPASWTNSPQVALLAALKPLPFVIVNVLLMYTVGFVGCVGLKRREGLGTLAFAVLVMLLLFNGGFVEKMTAYGPGMLGYLLVPWWLLALWSASAPEPLSRAQQWRRGLWWGFVMAAISWQGSFHLFVQSATFLLVWAACNARRWRTALAALISAGLLASIRLLPAILAYGAGVNRHRGINYGDGGYRHPEQILEVLAMTRTHLSVPVFTWWVFGLYISVIGVLLVVGFGLWAPWARARWARYRWGYGVAIPAIALSLLAMRDWHNRLIPSWMPLLNAEANTALYLYMPLMIASLAACVNLDRYMRAPETPARARWTLVAAALAMAGFLANHSRLWRMPRVQAEFSAIASNPVVVPHIANNPADRLYILACQGGIALTVGALVAWTVCMWMLRGSTTLRGQHAGAAR